ncbi:MAG: hypothetical protein ACPGCQ_01730, partial [Synechococcus sp.]
PIDPRYAFSHIDKASHGWPWGLALLLVDHSTEARPGACQSYEAAFNLEAGMRDGLTLKQAKASILEDGCTDGSAACFGAIKNEINQMPYA